MPTDIIDATIVELTKERDRLTEEKDRLERAIQALQTTNGRPTKTPSQKAPTRRRDLAGAVRKVLKNAKQPLTPMEIRDKLLASSFRGDDPKSLYQSVFSAVKRDPGIRKTKKGISLIPTKKPAKN